MKKVSFKYNSIQEIKEFLSSVKLTSYQLDAYKKQLDCNACEEIKRIAVKYGLVIIDEKEMLLTSNTLSI